MGFIQRLRNRKQHRQQANENIVNSAGPPPGAPIKCEAILQDNLKQNTSMPRQTRGTGPPRVAATGLNGVLLTRSTGAVQTEGAFVRGGKGGSGASQGAVFGAALGMTLGSSGV